MFNSILKFFTNYFLILFLVIGVGLFTLGALVNSFLDWNWLLYFFIIFKSLISIIWFLPFDVIFVLLGYSLSLYAGYWSFRIIILVYNWFKFSNK